MDSIALLTRGYAGRAPALTVTTAAGTTFEAIRDAIIVILEALTPATQGARFRRHQQRQPLRRWAPAHAGASLRTFEIERQSPKSDPPLHDPALVERQVTARLSVAYPVLPGAYGRGDLDDMADVIDADARQLRDAIYSPGALISGQLAAFVDVQPIDRTLDEIHFLDLMLDLRFFESQSLT